MERVVSYDRVSTKSQSERHGLDAQRTIRAEYAARNNLVVIKEFVEVESGSNKERPVLKEALNYCELTGCRLITARLDRGDPGFRSRDHHLRFPQRFQIRPERARVRS